MMTECHHNPKPKPLAVLMELACRLEISTENNMLTLPMHITKFNSNYYLCSFLKFKQIQRVLLTFICTQPVSHSHIFTHNEHGDHIINL